MSTNRKHPAELRERATRLAVEPRKNPETERVAIPRVAKQLGIHPETLRDWVRKAETDNGTRPGVTTAEAALIVGVADADALFKRLHVYALDHGISKLLLLKPHNSAPGSDPPPTPGEFQSTK